MERNGRKRKRESEIEIIASSKEHIFLQSNSMCILSPRLQGGLSDSPAWAAMTASVFGLSYSARITSFIPGNF